MGFDVSFDHNANHFCNASPRERRKLTFVIMRTIKVKWKSKKRKISKTTKKRKQNEPLSNGHHPSHHNRYLRIQLTSVCPLFFAFVNDDYCQEINFLFPLMPHPVPPFPSPQPC